MRFSAATAALALASCGGSEPADTAPTEHLSAEAQQIRYERCSAEFAKHRESGLVKHGGARPAVDTDMLDGMSNADQQAFAETVACLANGGQVGATEVEVTAEGASSAYRTYKAANAG